MTLSQDKPSQKESSAGPIAVLGAGSYGTALAILLHNNANDVRLWGRSVQQMNTMQETHQNERYLPDVNLPESMSLYSDLECCLEGVTDVLVAVPSTQFELVLQRLKSIMKGAWRLVWVTKGLDKQSNQLLSTLAARIFSETFPVALLSGPSFAKEVAQQVLTAVTITGNNKPWCDDLVERFHSDYFRVYYNPDFTGVQLCAVGKNVLAIAVGIVDGMGLGANSKAALMTRGMAELQRLLSAVGADSNTLLSLAGVGDIVLTCTDNQSRNRRFGIALGSGLSIAEAEKKVGNEIEGRNNVAQFYALSQLHSVDMPVVEQMYLFLDQKITLAQAVSNLMQRPANVEF
jgi:glycerol-3-phosphate dehydrogenase (NAD(P)+)